MSSTTQPAVSWHRGRVAGWLVSVDHKRLGVLYLGWAAVFLAIAGILTVLMRLQLTQPNSSVLSSDTYAELRTIAAESERVRRYVETQHRHLLTAYDADFLVDAIRVTKSRLTEDAPGAERVS